MNNIEGSVGGRLFHTALESSNGITKGWVKSDTSALVLQGTNL